MTAGSAGVPWKRKDGRMVIVSKDRTIKRAEEMRQKKIESLKKQIKKLEEMRFE